LTEILFQKTARTKNCPRRFIGKNWLPVEPAYANIFVTQSQPGRHWVVTESPHPSPTLEWPSYLKINTTPPLVAAPIEFEFPVSYGK